MKERSRERVKGTKKTSGTDNRVRARSLAELGRMFDDLYSQLDLQLTRMAQIQLQFDALRSKIRLL